MPRAKRRQATVRDLVYHAEHMVGARLEMDRPTPWPEHQQEKFEREYNYHKSRIREIGDAMLGDRKYVLVDEF